MRLALPFATCTLALALAAACGSNDTVFGPSAAGGSTAAGGAPATTTASAGGGGTSTVTTSTGGGGSEPCGGVDCASIPAPPCKVSVCNEATDQCEVVDDADGAACDDGLFCTINTVCEGGACVGGEENTCGLVASGCEVIACDEAQQTCSPVPGNEGAPCTPPDLCQQMGVCAGGTCEGPPKDCSFVPLPNECFVPGCNPGTGVCEAVPGNDGQPCLDGDLCTLDTTCSAGVCGGGIPVDCSGASGACTVGACNPSDGSCVAQPANEGASCDDGSACTTGDLCQGGVCVGTPTGASCGAADGCCPSNCPVGGDPDCSFDVLLMGDDVGQAGWNTYRGALSDYGLSWTERDLNNAPFPSASDLAGFNTLIWFDDAFVAQGDAEFQVVVDWLDSGDKHLFVTSRLFLTDMENGPVGQGERNLYDRVGAARVGQTASFSISVLEGIVNDPVGGDFVAPNELTISGVGSLGDYASPSTSLATTAALYGPGGAGDGSGDAALTHFDAGTYKAVWLGVNFHDGLDQQSQRSALMENIFDWFAL